jgi:acyl-CoA thioesterase-1
MTPQQSAELAKIKSLLAGNEPIRWLFAGDSITHGALHTWGARDYTEHFSERVRFEMQRGRDHVIKTGISGWRVTGLAADLEWGVLQYRPHVVSINFGMNDCTGGAAALEAFGEAYLDVINKTRAHCGAAFIVHVPNAIFPEDKARFENLPAYSETVREVAAETGAALIDHPAEWREKILWYRMNDAIHPNDVGHREMAFSMFRLLGIFDAEKSEVCRLFVPAT